MASVASSSSCFTSAHFTTPHISSLPSHKPNILSFPLIFSPKMPHLIPQMGLFHSRSSACVNLEGRRMDIGALIIRHWFQVHAHSRMSIPHGMVITRLLQHFGLNLDAEVIAFRQPSVINRGFLRRRSLYCTDVGDVFMTDAVVTKDSWEKSILRSDTPVLIEFYASWCGPCKMVHRVIDEIAREYTGRLKCFMLNADSELQIAEDYEIKAVPVVLLFKDGEKRETVVGTMPKDFYISAIERVLKS